MVVETSETGSAGTTRPTASINSLPSLSTSMRRGSGARTRKSIFLAST
jgi:hypothetical protein